MPEIVVHSRQVEMLPLDALKSYEKNARTHPDNQITTLVNIIRDSGFTNPVLIDDDDVIIAGHGRVAAANKLKMTEVPCVRVSGLTPEQIKALRLSDNQSGLLSGYDDAILRLELGDLQASGFDLSLTGFTSLDLSKLFAVESGETDPDEVPETPKVPASRLGDLWRLGEHYLVNGDCTNPTAVAAALAGHKPPIMITDSPYGVSYDANWRNEAMRADGSPSDGRAIGKVKNDERVDWREAWALFPGDVAYCWHADRHASSVQASLEAVGFEIRSQIIWAKTRFAIGRGHYHWQHEPCWYAVKKGKTAHWVGDRKQSTLWEISHVKSETGHSTQKPIECMKRPIENNSEPGGHIYEPFSGSGTLIIAAQMTKRVAHALEIESSYVDVSILRWQNFTGQQATLSETGETYAQVKERRSGDGEVI